LAVNLSGFQDHQGSERKIEKIIVANLSTRQTCYEEILDDSDYVIDYWQFDVAPAPNSSGYALFFGLSLELGNIVDSWEDTYALCFDDFIQDQASISELKAASQKAL
jgi:hypothetical protein